MKNLLLALPLIAGVSWAGTTLYSGAQTQPAYNRLLAQLNNSKILAVKSVEYEAGFTSSTAITEVRLNNSKTDERVYLQHKISHSPVSMVPENARFGAAKIVTTLMVDKFEDEDTKAFLNLSIPVNRLLFIPTLQSMERPPVKSPLTHSTTLTMTTTSTLKPAAQP